MLLIWGVVDDVTCEFTIDNYLYNLYIDGVEKTSEVSGDFTNWQSIKTITFDSSASTIAIFGADKLGGCTDGGFAMQCTSLDPYWNYVQTDASWKAVGNNGGDIVGTSCPAGWETPSFDDSSWENAMFGSTHAGSVIGVIDICGDYNSWCFRKQVEFIESKKV